MQAKKSFSRKLLFWLLVATWPTTLFCLHAQQQKMLPTRIPQIAAIPGKGDWLDGNKAVAQFEIEMKAAADENKKIPLKDATVFRIMTYNVHFWMSPNRRKDYLNEMVAVIATINPDLVILQEVSPHAGYPVNKPLFADASARQDSPAIQGMKRIGFTHFSSCNTMTDGKSWFGNLIASKVPFMQKQEQKFHHKIHCVQERCYLGVRLKTPDNKELVIYGTHLEVQEDDAFRQRQMKEVIDRDEKEHAEQNFIIAGDFNATRNSLVTKILKDKGFTEAFNSCKWEHPTLTNWTGKEIDFIFLSPGWKLPLAGCYVYYDATSDHLPLIMDIVLKKNEPQNPRRHDLAQLHSDLLALAYAAD